MARLLLKEVLVKKKLSKRRFAKLLDVEYSNIFRYFRDDYDPKLSMIERWAKVLGVRIRDLYQENQKDDTF